MRSQGPHRGPARQRQARVSGAARFAALQIEQHKLAEPFGIAFAGTREIVDLAGGELRLGIISTGNCSDSRTAVKARFMISMALGSNTAPFR